MCDYCGCREQPIIVRFARDHEELMHRARIVATLRRHIEVEEHDIFPASLVYLGPEDWEVIESADPEASPS
ncbi:MAG: hypothetical protein IT198_13375 [Acidimicrobiia bacterium]|nr:hypothetical protein [Acidimicrobiia bacterium]